MQPPMAWRDLVASDPTKAFEYRLLVLVDQYAVSKDVNEMKCLRERIGACVTTLAHSRPYRSKIVEGFYIDLKCPELTGAGYCLTVQPSGLPAPANEFHYRIYLLHNGRNVVTSPWV